jgi:hypothetical protein
MVFLLGDGRARIGGMLLPPEQKVKEDAGAEWGSKQSEVLFNFQVVSLKGGIRCTACYI